MKKLVIFAAMMSLGAININAQDDDMYFTPSKKAKAAAKAQYAAQNDPYYNSDASDTYYSGINKSVDEYNRRGGSYSGSYTVADSVSADSLMIALRNSEDYKNSQKLAKYDGGQPVNIYITNNYDPWYYDYWYRPGWSISFGIGWGCGWAYDPWWYGPGWGPRWYGPGPGWWGPGYWHGPGWYGPREPLVAYRSINRGWSSRGGSYSRGYSRSGSGAYRDSGSSRSYSSSRSNSYNNSRSNSYNSSRSNSYNNSRSNGYTTSRSNSGSSNYSSGARSSFGGGGGFSGGMGGHGGGGGFSGGGGHGGRR